MSCDQCCHEKCHSPCNHFLDCVCCSIDRSICLVQLQKTKIQSKAASAMQTNRSSRCLGFSSECLFDLSNSPRSLFPVLLSRGRFFDSPLDVFVHLRADQSPRAVGCAEHKREKGKLREKDFEKSCRELCVLTAVRGDHLGPR